jgi:glutathione S-transferase
MSEIVVYGIPGSPFVRSVQLCLEEKSLSYRMDALNPGTIRGGDHVERHPFGRVPVIDHGDYRLYETQAILRYLDAAFPDPSLQPSEPRAIGRINQIVGINDWYFFPKVAAVIVFNRIVGPVLMGKTPDEAAIAAAIPGGGSLVDCRSDARSPSGFFTGDQGGQKLARRNEAGRLVGADEPASQHAADAASGEFAGCSLTVGAGCQPVPG